MDASADKLRDFAKNSIRLVKKCEKPDRKEFFKTARVTALGFLATGLIGFVVKVIFIPINQIIIGSTQGQ